MDYLKMLFVKEQNISLEDIDFLKLNKAEKIMARVVKEYGTDYLSVFIRIHKEIKLRKPQSSYENIALQMANDNSL